MSNENLVSAKKRIMFIKGEDFNFLAYNILITLDALECREENRSFIDHRKLSYLVDLVSSPCLASLLDRHCRVGGQLGKQDVHLLTTAYINGASRKHLVARVLGSLSTKGYVRLTRGDRDVALNLWLNTDAIPMQFLASALYATERNNVQLLRNVSKLLRKVIFSTFLDKYFATHGVRVWHS